MVVKNTIPINDEEGVKKVRSEGYNYNFRYSDGFFVRWGTTLADDPEFSPFGPEIADIEISTVCHGVNGKPCSHCYKSNTGKGKNMTFETFKTIFDKIIDAKIIITTEDGNKIMLNPNDKIKLTNGNIILAEEIKDGDDIDEIC